MSFPKSQQYIRVKKMELPDPALFCPPRGYYPIENPPGEWKPPIDYPDPETEQILLLCDDLEYGRISYLATVTAGLIKCEILSEDMTILSTATHNSGVSYNLAFPTIGTDTLYIVRITPSTAGSSILSFRRDTWTGYDYQRWRIHQAKFYTPNITTLNNAFQNLDHIRQCSFYTNLNSLASAFYMFAGSGITNTEFTEMNSLVDAYYMFDNTLNVREVVFPSALPALVRADYMFNNSYVESAIIPASLPSLKNMAYMFAYSRLKIIPVFTHLPEVNSIGRVIAFMLNIQVTEYSFPSMPKLLQASYVMVNTPLKKLKFSGSYDVLVTVNYLLDQHPTIEEIEFPTYMPGGSGLSTDWQSWQRLARGLRKIVMPLSMPDFFPSGDWATNWPLSVEQITTCNNWGTLNHRIIIAVPLLNTFWQPTLKVSQLNLGYSATIPCQLTEVEVDWANSDYSFTTVAIIIMAQLPASEINRIFTALPSMTKTIDVRYNPGYATCDKTIATAKGWTVS